MGYIKNGIKFIGYPAWDLKLRIKKSLSLKMIGMDEKGLIIAYNM